VEPRFCFRVKGRSAQTEHLPLGRQKCDRRAIGPLGDKAPDRAGSYALCPPDALNRGAYLVYNFSLFPGLSRSLAEGEGFEPSTRLDDV
jgi:hypothetical protein